MTVCTSLFYFFRSHFSFYCGRISRASARKRIVVQDYRPRVVSEIMDGTYSPEENVTTIVHHVPRLSQHNVYTEKSMSRPEFYAEASWKSLPIGPLFFSSLKTNSQLRCRRFGPLTVRERTSRTGGNTELKCLKHATIHLDVAPASPGSTSWFEKRRVRGAEHISTTQHASWPDQLPYRLPLKLIIIQQSLLYMADLIYCMDNPDSNNNSDKHSYRNVRTFDWPHEEQHAGRNILFFPAVVLPRCTVL